MTKAGKGRGRRWVGWVAGVLAGVGVASGVAGRAGAQKPEAGVPVLLLSDIHFDPFADPGKVEALRRAPAADWRAILQGADSPQRAELTAQLEGSCKERGKDTDWPLWSSSLESLRAHAGSAKFATVDGDTMAHGFACKFEHLDPKATAADLSDFSSKTVEFVTLTLHAALPRVPVYFALGNNDSGCADYRETPGSEFLKRTGAAFATAGNITGTGERAAMQRSFRGLGDYRVSLPAPMRNVRLLVLQNIFASSLYRTCAGEKAGEGKAGGAGFDPAGAQLAWLRGELIEARAAGAHVWVMAHVPPGIDVYSTVTRHRNVCGGDEPVMFEPDDRMTALLTEFADVMRLTLLAHTHADEFRLLHAEAGAPNVRGGGDVAAKLTPSISPVNGNDASFTLAEVRAGDGTLLDWTVWTRGGFGNWKPVYSFRKTYGVPDYSAKTVRGMVDAMVAEGQGRSAAVASYAHLYFPGDSGLHEAAMRLLWPTYGCSLRETTPKGYAACYCAITEKQSGQ